MRKSKKTTTATDLADLDTDDIPFDDLPAVEVGETVLWSPDQGGTSIPAMCMAVGKGINRSRIDLQITHPETVTLDYRTGIPHENDPRSKAVVDEDIGVWRLGPVSERLHLAEQDIEDIKLSLAGAPRKMDELAKAGTQ